MRFGQGALVAVPCSWQQTRRHVGEAGPFGSSLFNQLQALAVLRCSSMSPFSVFLGFWRLTDLPHLHFCCCPMQFEDSSLICNVRNINARYEATGVGRRSRTWTYVRHFVGQCMFAPVPCKPEEGRSQCLHKYFSQYLHSTTGESFQTRPCVSFGCCT